MRNLLLESIHSWIRKDMKKHDYDVDGVIEDIESMSIPALLFFKAILPTVCVIRYIDTLHRYYQ